MPRVRPEGKTRSQKSRAQDTEGRKRRMLLIKRRLPRLVFRFPNTLHNAFDWVHAMKDEDLAFMEDKPTFRMLQEEHFCSVKWKNICIFQKKAVPLRSKYILGADVCLQIA